MLPFILDLVCPSISTPAHMLSDNMNTSVSSVITFSCIPGYRTIHGHSSTTVMCTNQKLWNDTIEDCEGQNQAKITI